MIVVDVGCQPHPGKGRCAGGEESVYKLCERFHPDVLIGFDPLVEDIVSQYTHEGHTTTIMLRQALAWHEPVPGETFPVLIRDDSTHQPRGAEDGDGWFPAVSIPDLLDCLPRPVIVKFDCEGCEYPILHEIRRRDIDLTLDLVLIEWHDWIYPPTGRQVSHGWEEFGKTELRCPVEGWEV